MGFKTLIRTIVVKTNPIPPFARLNRIPYSLAVRSMKRLAAVCPGVQSVYLRHGLTRPNWEPGLSDIDFTVVLSGNLTQEQEYENVQAFMASYRALKRWFPMLGEIEILNDKCCSAWSRFSVRGSEVGEWRLLQGMDSIKPAYVENEIGVSKDRLDHACWIYQSQVLKRFYAVDSDTWIERKALLRIAGKLFRYSRGGSAAGTPEQGALPERASGIVLQVLENLDEALQKAPQRSGPEPALPGSRRRFQEEAPRPGYQAEKFEGLQEFDSIIMSVILSFSISFIILRDGICLGALKDDLEKIRTICRSSGIQPLIMTRNLFLYYLQSFRPRVFLELREYRHVLFGADLLKEIAEPTQQALAGELLNQSLNAMLAPAHCVLAHSGHAINPEWVGHAWRSAFLLLYLDAGVIGSHQRSVKACRERYPELCGEIRRLSESRDPAESLARAVHGMLRRCAMDINEKIERLDPGWLPAAEILSANPSEDVN